MRCDLALRAVICGHLFTDANGTHGCWYIGLKELMRTLKDDQEEDKHAFIRGKIEEFEKEHKEAREEAFETHANALEEGEDSDED